MAEIKDGFPRISKKWMIIMLSLLLFLPSCSWQQYVKQEDQIENISPSSTDTVLPGGTGKANYINLGKLFNLLVIDILINIYNDNYQQVIELDASNINNIKIVDSDRLSLSFAYMELGSLDISLIDHDNGYIWTRKMFKPEIEETINNLRSQYDLKNYQSISFEEWLGLWTFYQAVSFYEEYIIALYDNAEIGDDDDLLSLLSRMNEIWGIELINNSNEPISIHYYFPVGQSSLKYEIQYKGELVFEFTRQITDWEGRGLQDDEFDLEFEI